MTFTGIDQPYQNSQETNVKNAKQPNTIKVALAKVTHAKENYELITGDHIDLMRWITAYAFPILQLMLVTTSPSSVTILPR